MEAPPYSLLIVVTFHSSSRGDITEVVAFMDPMMPNFTTRTTNNLPATDKAPAQASVFGRFLSSHYINQFMILECLRESGHVDNPSKDSNHPVL